MPTHGKWAGPPARAVSESRAAGVSHPENDPIHVLSASPFRADHDVIERCLQRQWTLRRAFTLPAARAILQDGGRIPLVVCDCGLRPGSWRDLLGEMSSVSDPPLFIVTSQCADDYLWAEALNLGAYDVLAKPFDDSELARALHSAWARWSSRAGHPRTADHRRSGNRAPRPAA